MLATLAVAQQRSRNRETAAPPASTAPKKTKRGPRAIAVVEFLPNGAMRLVPIALWIEGRYYDASLYGANPEPMALEPQTVYEAQSFGEPTGTFTVTFPKQINGNWVADGTWQPQLAMDTQLKAKAAKDAAQQAKNPASKAVLTGDADDGRPVLKRAPGSTGDTSGSGQSSSSSTPAPATTTTDSDRPVMKRPATDSGKPTLGPTDDAPASASAPSTTAKSQTQVDDHDPDRPVMKRPASATAPVNDGTAASGSSTVSQSAAASDDSDPNRPVLSRNKIVTPASAPAAESVVAKSGKPAGAQKPSRAYPAISDAGIYQSRPLIYSMSSGERQVQEQQLLKLALDDIRAFAAKRHGPAVPKTATITDYDVRAFDLEFSSSPTLVLTAKLPIPKGEGQNLPDFNYYVSIVARVDINDQAQKIFTSVTDSRHLDAFPRMELIDAIDADSNGRGNLLFRQYSDTGISYGLYRVSPYQIEKIFEGGSSL
jgi:hypothetical protein